MIRRLGAVVAATVVAGCPAPGERAPSAKEPCAKLGQACEFSPGKLGSCVQRDDCATPPCFVCQSQH